MRNATRKAAPALPLLLVSLAAAVPSARADIIHLRNGSQITGTVVERSGGRLKVRVAGGVIFLKSSEVLYVERESPPQRLVSEARDLSSAGRTREALAKLDLARREGAPRELVSGLRMEFLKIEASRLEAAGRFAEAYEVLSRARKLAPADETVLRSLERLERGLATVTGLVEDAGRALRTGDPARAVELLERALRDSPQSRDAIRPELAAACVALADRLARERDAAALGWYNRAIAIEPGRAEKLRLKVVVARIFRIRDMVKAGKLKGGLAASEKLVRDAPGVTFTRFQRATILDALRRSARAREEYLSLVPEAEREGKTFTGRRGLRELRRLAEKHATEQFRSFREDALRERAERARVEVGPERELAGRHFVVHHRNEKLAREILEAADSQAERIVRELGLRAKVPWDEPCPVYVLPDRESYLRKTGQADWSVGLTHTELIGDGRLMTQISVYQTGTALVSRTIPHEVAHVVLFALTENDTRIPLALHEGFAVSREPGWTSDRETAKLLWKRLAGGIVPLRELFTMKRAGLRPDVFYAESASLVEFLVGRKGLKEFLLFARDVGARGPSAAVRAHYGFPDIEALERAWLDSLGR